MQTGFIKVSAVSPVLTLGDVKKNTAAAVKAIREEAAQKAQIIVLPELFLSGSTCGDLFLQSTLLNACREGLIALAEETKACGALIAVGLPLQIGTALYNCAAVLQSGKILGVVPKMQVSARGDVQDARWFQSGGKANFDFILLNGEKVPFGKILFTLSDTVTVGIELGDDLFAPVPPSTDLCLAGANVILNLSAKPAYAKTDDYRLSFIRTQSAKLHCAYVYASAGYGESTTDIVFSGACTIAENGKILAESELFSLNGTACRACADTEKLCAERLNRDFTSDCTQKDTRVYGRLEELTEADIDRIFPTLPFVPENIEERKARCREIFTVQSMGLARRMQHTRTEKLVLGISGGLDSTLALLVAVKTMEALNLPKENLLCITMPGFGTTDVTYTNALELMQTLGTTVSEIDIKPACIRHMQDIGHDIAVHDVTYENTQARERTQILMDYANKNGALLVGTGDLSELALGWCTYNGDHMSMYGVNAGVPKTLVRYLVAHAAEEFGGKTAEILQRVLDTPVSPELLPPDPNGKIEQKTEDTLGPYEVHDFYLYDFLRFGARPEKLLMKAKKAFGGKYTAEELKKWLRLFIRRFFISQFKRSCLPDGPKTGSVGLSPRGDFKMPSDASFAEWLNF